MKGFSSVIKVGGLRSDSIGGRNAILATECKNAVLHKAGIEGYVPLILTLPTIYVGATPLDLSVRWPFPQVFKTDSGIYIGTDTGLYSVACVAGVWTATSLTSGYTGAITWPWTIADCPMFPVFASGDLFVYYDYDSTAWIARSKAYSTEGGTRWHDDWYPPISACFFRGQIVVSGSATDSGTVSQQRVVRWTEIGNFDFLGMTATPRKNTSGELYAPGDETVMRVMALSDAIMVYGTQTVFAMKPVEKPAPTYSVDSVSSDAGIIAGINSPLAVGGNYAKHLVVDRTGCLFLVSQEKGGLVRGAVTVKNLGYQEFLYPLVQGSNDCVTSRVNVTYNSDYDEFYISDGKTGFIYNSVGLTKSTKQITSLMVGM